MSTGVKFNFDTQKWYDSDGNEVPEQEGWDFPCIHCVGPAKYRDHNCYYEFYDCLDCGKTTNVN